MLRKLSVSLALCLLLTSCLGLFSCADPGINGPTPDKDDPMANVAELTFGVAPTYVATSDPMRADEFLALQRSFGVGMFQNVYAAHVGDNTLISPLSILVALSMAANGTGAGETRAQMLQVLCGASSVEGLTEQLSAYLGSLRSSEYASLHSANSVWFRDDPSLQVKDSFLSSMAGNFGADVYKAPFDQTTVDAINAWCSEHTDGMIPEVINQIDPTTMLYLINALLFDAQWENTYRASNVSDAKFTTADGVQQDVKLMYSVEERYLHDDYAVGTYKWYADGGYKFVAMLPNEDVTVEQYVASLTGEGIDTMMRESEWATVKTKLPKFTAECSYTLNDILSAMGMPAAFEPGVADFSEMGTYGGGGLHISSVIHKTAIEVNEIGTRAAAVTVVAADGESAPMEPPKTYEITFDRPFVYMIMDRSNVPLFIGVVNEVG